MSDSFLKQFERSKAEIKHLKEATPYIFHEWQALEAAKEALKLAQLRLVQAQQRWDDL